MCFYRDLTAISLQSHLDVAAIWRPSPSDPVSIRASAVWLRGHVLAIKT